MAEQQVHQVKLHTSNSVWIFYLIFLAMMGAFLYFLLNRLNDEDDNAEIAPYSLDLRSEGAPVSIDYVNRWHVVATIDRAEGKEIRLYDPDTGKLVGTYWEPASAEAASDEDESGAE